MTPTYDNLRRSEELQRDARNAGRRSEELQRDTRNAGREFLKTELNTALTFVRAALQSGGDTDRKHRNQANARKAYDTIMKLNNNVPLPEDSVEGHAFARGLEELKAALEQLGESI